MRNLLQGKRYLFNPNILSIACLAMAACSVVWPSAARSQPVTNAEEVLELPLVTNPPPSGTFWLYSSYGMWGLDQFGPPIPSNPWGSNVNVFSFTNEYGTQFIIDDTPIVEAQAQLQSRGFSMSED